MAGYFAGAVIDSAGVASVEVFLIIGAVSDAYLYTAACTSEVFLESGFF